MATSLIDLNFTTAGDSEIYAAIESFIDSGAPQPDRQAEGYTVDFKEEWGEKSLRIIASFANTFGGTIVIGVSESGGRANEIVGIETKAELKTKIAGSISANISPIPDYDIAECGKPSDSLKRIAVIRVRSDNRLHYLLKKGESSPIYIRNVDQSIPASASELRALIENERNHVGSAQVTVDPFKANPEAFRVTRAKSSGSAQERRRDRLEAQSHLRVAIRPARPVNLPLDYAFEEHFKEKVAWRFEEYQEAVMNDIGAESDTRSSNSYIYKILRDGVDVESIWSVTADATLGFASTVSVSAHRPIWSLPDMVANLVSCIELADDLLGGAGYYGGISVDVELKPGGAVIANEGVGAFTVLLRKSFYKTAWPIVIPGFRELPLHKTGRTSAGLDFNQRNGDLDPVVTQMVNQLLRDLDCAADRKALRGAVAGRHNN
jgi:hypothetical protein